MIATVMTALLLSGAAARATRVYTNADLERVHPLAPETGGSSSPAAAPAPAAPPAASRGPASRGEDYWRREKQRVAKRLGPLDRAIEDLRGRIAERERLPEVRPVSDPQLLSLRTQLQRALERRRAIESELEDRARRAGALPGWLR